MVLKNMFFEDIGFTYLGPIDGHDIEKIESTLELSKKIKGPVLVHVVTKKGKGYEIAEKNSDKFHGVSKYDIETGYPIVGGDSISVRFNRLFLSIRRNNCKISREK